MYSATTIHNVRNLMAHTPFSLGAPLILTLTADRGVTCTVTVFLGNQDLVNRLVAAINSVVMPDEPHEPDHQAVHQAHGSF